MNTELKVGSNAIILYANYRLQNVEGKIPTLTLSLLYSSDSETRIGKCEIFFDCCLSLTRFCKEIKRIRISKQREDLYLLILEEDLQLTWHNPTIYLRHHYAPLSYLKIQNKEGTEDFPAMRVL